MKQVLMCFVIGVGVLGLSSCGAGGETTPPPPSSSSTITSVTVSPKSANLLVKATQQFTANVQGTGSFNAVVNWYVNEVQGGNATVGTISTNGFYSAPSTVPSPSSVTVKAQSVQDSTKSGASTVTVNPENVQVSISPTSGSAQLSSTLQFTAIVSGTVNTAVSWSVNSTQGGQSTIGFIDQNGLYTAPVNLPPNTTVTVSATSQEDSTKSASATVAILATAGGITVSVSPQNSSVTFDGSQSIQFRATVSGTSNSTVIWSVDPSYAAIGQISSSGLFTPFGFNCTNVPISGVIRAVSVVNAGAQGLSLVNLVPPAPTITGLSPQPADAETLVQVSGAFAVGAEFTALYSGPNGTTILGVLTTTSANAVSGPVPLGASSGPLSIRQSCVSASTGFQYPNQQSNSLQFLRLPRLRVRANRQVLTSGESTQMLTAFLGDPTPQPISWSALFGSVRPDGVFTAGTGNWDKVTGCISGTQQCDFFVFSVVPARIEPTVPVVSTAGTVQLSEVQANTTLSASWMIEAGGGTLSSSGLYNAPTTLQDSGAIPVTATATAGSATNAISVVGSFPGMVNRVIDYPDISSNATGQTTIPKSVAVDGNRVYVLSDNLPPVVANGHYKWIDLYDASDRTHPAWTGAVEGFDQDLDTFPMQTFASNSFLWRVTAPQIINGAGSPTSEVAFYDSSSGQPILKQLFTVPRMWVYSFYQGLLIGIPSLFTATGQAVWQSPVTVLVFDGRTGTVFQSQIRLTLPNPSTPASIEGIAVTATRLFLLFQQQQSDGSLPFFVSTYDLTSSPAALLQTTSAQPGPVLFPGEPAVRIFGNLLFAGGGVYDVSTELPTFLAPIEIGPPEDMSGSLALLGPAPDLNYRLVDYSTPPKPRVTALLSTGDDLFIGNARFVANHPYIVGSGVQVFDVTAPAGGPIRGPALPGSGGLAVFNDLLVASSHLYAAEATDIGSFVTTYDLSQAPPQKIGSFALGNEIPYALAADSNFLFVGTSTELIVLDVSNPASPAEITTLALPTSCLALSGNVLYAGTTDNRLMAIDVTNPASPLARSSTNLAGFPVTMQANGSLLLIAADIAGLLTYSILNPSAPTPLSQFRPSTAVESVTLDGNLALLAAADSGFVIADMTNPAAPVLAGQVPLAPLTCFAELEPTQTPGLVSISGNNGIAYLGTTNMYGVVFGFDYRQPAHPRLVSAAFYGNAIVESVLAFAFSGSQIFVAGDMFYDLAYEADITQPRNFIRHMCSPPPFGTSAGVNFPELQARVSAFSMWNPKAHLRKDWGQHP